MGENSGKCFVFMTDISSDWPVALVAVRALVYSMRSVLGRLELETSRTALPPNIHGLASGVAVPRAIALLWTSG